MKLETLNSLDVCALVYLRYKILQRFPLDAEDPKCEQIVARLKEAGLINTGGGFRCTKRGLDVCERTEHKITRHTLDQAEKVTKAKPVAAGGHDGIGPEFLILSHLRHFGCRTLPLPFTPRVMAALKNLKDVGYLSDADNSFSLTDLGIKTLEYTVSRISQDLPINSTSTAPISTEPQVFRPARPTNSPNQLATKPVAFDPFDL